MPRRTPRPPIAGSNGSSLCPQSTERSDRRPRRAASVRFGVRGLERRGAASLPPRRWGARHPKSAHPRRAGHRGEEAALPSPTPGTVQAGVEGARGAQGEPHREADCHRGTREPRDRAPQSFPRVQDRRGTGVGAALVQCGSPARATSRQLDRPRPDSGRPKFGLVGSRFRHPRTTVRGVAWLYQAGAPAEASADRRSTELIATYPAWMRPRPYRGSSTGAAKPERSRVSDVRLTPDDRDRHFCTPTEHRCCARSRDQPIRRWISLSCTPGVNRGAGIAVPARPYPTATYPPATAASRTSIAWSSRWSVRS